MSGKRKRIRINVLSLWIGILIPIIAAVIPFVVVKYVIPEHKLNYKLVGPIVVDRLTAIKLSINNKGTKTEKNVRVWIKRGLVGTTFQQDDKTKTTLSDILVDPKAKFSTSKEGDYHVLSMGDLRPEESVTFSVLLRGHQPLIGMVPEYLSIKSDDHIAEIKDGHDIFAEFLYPFGFWMSVILLALMGAYAIYYEYFMDPTKKEKLILDAIDKLGK